MLMAGFYWMRAQIDRLAGEAGQDFIEYALILGVIALVIIFAFLTTGVEDAVKELSSEVACAIKGGTWTAGSGTTPGSCG